MQMSVDLLSKFHYKTHLAKIIFYSWWYQRTWTCPDVQYQLKRRDAIHSQQLRRRRPEKRDFCLCCPQLWIFTQFKRPKLQRHEKLFGINGKAPIDWKFHDLICLSHHITHINIWKCPIITTHWDNWYHWESQDKTFKLKYYTVKVNQKLKLTTTKRN